MKAFGFYLFAQCLPVNKQLSLSRKCQPSTSLLVVKEVLFILTGDGEVAFKYIK